MRPIATFLAALALSALGDGAFALDQPTDPIGDLISQVNGPATDGADWGLRATFYHAGRGIAPRDSSGCRVSPMRTAAVDPSVVSRHSIIFIKETAGMVLPDGSVHDGYWYASDTGGAIRGKRIDLFTGAGGGSMRPLLTLNDKVLTVAKVGDFAGCPPLDGGAARRLASAAP